MKLRNIPGEPIVTRDRGVRFYCIACFKTYQKCKCRVYMSADTLPARDSKTAPKRESRTFTARQAAT